MRTRCLFFLIALVGLAGSAAVSHAQVPNYLVMKVDHPFVVYDQTLPPGTYTVKRITESDPRVLTFASLTDHTTVIVLLTSGTRGHSNRGTATFDVVGDQYVLRKVELSDGGFEVPVSHALVSQLAQHQTLLASGKD